MEYYSPCLLPCFVATDSEKHRKAGKVNIIKATHMGDDMEIELAVQVGGGWAAGDRLAGFIT